MKKMRGGCCICSDEQGLPENPLVYCDGDTCTVAVHQACYGIITVPRGPWFCRRCESQERAAKVRCELCPQRDGALKKTDNNGWAHVVCALYIPEVRFGNVSTMEPIMLGLLPQDRWNKICYICDTKGRESKASFGACMQCNKPTCKNYFHVTCAQAEGLLCEEAGNYNDAVKYCGYCNHHYKKILESSEKVPFKDSKRFTLVTTRKDYPSIKPIPAFRPIPSHIPGLKSPEVEKNKSFNSSLSSFSSCLSSSLSSLSSFKPNAGSSDKHGSKSKSDDKFSRTIASDKTFHDKDHKGNEEKSKDKDSSEKDEISKKGSIRSMKDHHHSSRSKSGKGSKSSTEKEKDKNKKISPSTPSNTTSSVTSLTTSTNCTGLSSLSTLNDLNSTTRLLDGRPSGQFSLSSFIDPKLASKNQSKKAAEKDPKANASSSKEKDRITTSKEPGKSSTSSLKFGSSNGSHTSSKPSNSKSDSSSTKNRDSSSNPKSSVSASKNTHEKYSDGKKGSAASSSKRKVKPDSKLSSKSLNAKKRKRFNSSSSSSSDSDDLNDKSDSEDSDEGDIKSRKTPVTKSKGKTKESKSSNGRKSPKKVVASKSTAKGTKKSDSPQVNGITNSKGKSVNGTKQATSASKKKSKIVSSDDDDNEDEDESKPPLDDDDKLSKSTEPNLDDVEPKSKNKKASSAKEPSAMSSTTTGNNKQEKRAIHKSNGDIPSPSPSLTPMANKNEPTGHNADMDRVVHQQTSPASSFAFPPAPTSRQNRSSFPARDPSHPPPSSLEALLERQWAQGADFILDQAQNYDIASLLSCLSQLRQDNERLEDRLRHLTSRREHLLAVNARLASPLNGSFNTGHRSMPTGNNSNAPSSLPSSSSAVLPPPSQPTMGFQHLLNAAAVL